MVITRVSPNTDFNGLSPKPFLFLANIWMSYLYLAAAALTLLRIYAIMPGVRVTRAPRKNNSGTCSLAVFLGSGKEITTIPTST